MAMHNELWFPSVIWSAVINNVDNSALKKFAYAKIKEDPNGRKISNNKGYQSIDIRPKENAEIDQLVHILDREISEISQQTGVRMPKLYNIWVNVNYPGSSNNLHHHIGAMFSGVYYVDSDPNLNQGNISFQRGDNAEYHIPSTMIDKVTYFTAQQSNYASSTGGLFIFPGWLKHQVGTNDSNKDRISISFNYGEA
tara:strand:- start:132 stop:719 length:588 start_codon:yes stop_codon:yes gene_type:complete